jgi:hypothetical protein
VWVNLCTQNDRELISSLDHLGYDEAWIGEHHSVGWETIASPEVFIAAAGERTRTSANARRPWGGLILIVGVSRYSKSAARHRVHSTRGCGCTLP